MVHETTLENVRKQTVEAESKLAELLLKCERQVEVYQQRNEDESGTLNAKMKDL